nr:hypothetical protein [Tanacetum cinerariifolium]
MRGPSIADGEAMINSIQNGDQPLPVIAQVSLAGTAQNAPPTLKDPKFWTAEEKKTQKIDRLARSLLIQGLPNDIYSLIDSNKTAKDLCDALERQMGGSEYGKLIDTYLRYLQVINDLKKCGYKKDNCVLNYKFLNNRQQEWKQYATLMRQTKNLMDINIDALYNILKQNQEDVNDALGYKKKAIVVTSDPLALVAEKTNVSKRKEKVAVSLDSKGSGSDDFSELKKIAALQKFVKSNDKKKDNKADEKKRDMSKVKCYNCKKEGHFAKHCKKAKVKDYNYYKTKMLLAKKDSDEQVLLAEDQAWMESSSDSDRKSMQTLSSWLKLKSESEFETSEYYDNSTNYGLFLNNDDDLEIFHDAIESASENFIENHIDSQKDYDKSEKRVEKANQQSRDFKNQNKDVQEKYDVLINQVNTFEEQNNVLNEQIKVLNEKNADLLAQTKVLKDQLQVKHVVIDTHVECQEKYAKLEEEIYEYMIRYSALFDNDKQHRKHIADQEVLFDKMSFENPRYFEKAKDLRPSLYNEKVIGLGYTPMFLTHSDEALEIEKFKRSRENKIEFAYDYGNLNASYQTSSLKPYVLNVILEKIITDLEDEVVNLLEKEKPNLETIEPLKSKGFEWSETVVSESENQNENYCQVVKKECHKVENPKVIAPGMFNLKVS